MYFLKLREYTRFWEKDLGLNYVVLSDFGYLAPIF